MLMQHSTRGWFAVWATMMIIGLSPWNRAMAQATDEPSVTVKLQPDRIPPGGSVTISGLGYALPGSNIAIIVTNPSGVAAKLAAVPDKQSRYSTQYIGANAPGTYTVSAQTGSAKETPATAQFTVQNANIDIDEDVADNKKFLEDAQDLVTAVSKAVDNVPDSPTKTQMSAKLDKLKPALATTIQQDAKLSPMLQYYKNLIANFPQAQPAVQPLLDHLADLDVKTRDGIQTFAKISAESRKTLQSCDTIDQSTQALKALSEVLDIDHEPFEFVTEYTAVLVGNGAPQLKVAAGAAAKAANLAHALMPEGAKSLAEANQAAGSSIMENGIEIGSESALADKLVSGIPPAVRSSDGYKFAVAELTKVAPRIVGDGGDVIKQFLNFAFLVTDVSTFANQQFFTTYCQKFEGTFTATMKAWFYAAKYEHNDWWHYSTVIGGKLTLRYPKNTTGGNVPLTGQFEGGASSFTYDESVFVHSDLRKLAPGQSLLAQQDVAPLPADSGKGSLLAAIASPTSFYIPVTGEYVNGRVTFRLDAAREDFVDLYVKGHTFYVVASPYALIPVVVKFNLPYENAHFILNHFAFDYPAEQTKDSIVIEKTDSQDRPRPPGNEAYYILKLKACNPGCSGAE